MPSFCPRFPLGHAFARLVFTLLCFAPALRAQISIDAITLDTGWSETFDTLPTANFTWTNDSTLPGWFAVTGNGSLDSNARTADGGSNPSDLVIASVGTSGDPERALAYHTRVVTTPTYLGLAFTNDSGRDWTGFDVAYVAEQWREGTDNRTVELTVQYRIGAVAADLAATSDWTTLPDLSHDTLGGSAGARTALDSGLVNVPVPHGSTLWIRWRTTNTATSSTSSHDLLAIDDVAVTFAYDADPAAPVFTLQPVPRTIAVTESVTFTAAATGNPIPTFQWYFEGAEIPGATGESLTLTVVALTDAGSYTVVATNEAGSATSDAAVLTVSPTPLPPVITTGPIDTTANAGTSVSLTVLASGSAPFTYQWFHDGAPVGSDAAELLLANLQAADAGAYTVTVSNVSGSDTSAAATLTVVLPPTILTQPSSQVVGLGDLIQLAVVADGAGPLTYQWSKDDEPIAGATSASLSIAAATAGDAGDYTVEVSNDVGPTQSAVATITVLLPPAITHQPESIDVVVGTTVSFSVAAAGSPPLSYQWQKDGSDLAGATAMTLEIVSATVDDAGDYTVVVSNNVGVTTSHAATLSVHATAIAPTIAANPIGFTAAAETTASLSVSANGTAPFTYTWYHDGSPIAGATGATLLFDPIADADAGSYYVTVSNAGGSVASASAVVEVTPSTYRDYYVSPDGLEAANGTLAHPTTLESAILRVEPGYTIFLRGGDYAYDHQITIARDNAGLDETRRKRIFAYVSPEGIEEKPVLDFSSQPYGKTSQVSNPRGFKIDGHWWHLRGLEIFGAADNGIYVCGNYNIIERCSTHHNRDTGIQIGRYSSLATDKAEWPAYNLILNCDSSDNYDLYPNGGENADGFACKLTSGPGNVFRGWDLYTKSATGAIFPVVIDQCIAYSNGTLTNGTQNEAGDRNGFKLGGEKIAVVHYVTRCISFANGKNGFTWNSNPGAMLIMNNLAFDNAEGNFKFDQPYPLFYNNASLYTVGKGQNDRYGGNSGIATGDSNCFWYTGSSQRGPSINDQGITISEASFRTLVPPTGGFARNPDGSIDLGDFARPVDGSPLFDAGDLPPPSVWTELPYDLVVYYENDPDIGAVETRLAGIPTSGMSLLVFALGERAGHPGQPDLPTLERSGEHVSFSFRRLRSELSYTVEASSDLSLWQPIATDPGQVGDLIEVIEPVPHGAAPRFLRLRLEAR